jgi:predicted Zn-dependent protease
MKKNTAISWVFLGLLLTAILGGAAGCSNVPITGRSRSVVMDESQLASVSETEYKKLKSQAKISQDPSANAMVERVSKRLVATTQEVAKTYGFENDLKVFKWEFILLDDPKMVNAFCLPGGKIVVYTGILPIAKDDAGLAVIVGHEIAHAIAKHGNERMSQNAIVNFGGVILDKTLETSTEEARGLFGGIYGLGTTLGVLLPYSRLHETEADHIGLILMKKSGYDPKEAVAFWQRMSANSGGKAPAEFMSTHPSDAKRIADIQALIDKGL